MEGLTPGRIVHIVWTDGEHYPAIVTGVPWEGAAYLTMFRPLRSAEPMPIPVSFDDKMNQMTWHWIERA
jgi:hypothetical protein